MAALTATPWGCPRAALRPECRHHKNLAPPPRSQENSIAEAFSNQYGEVFARKVAIPLAEDWSGEQGRNLSAAGAEKISSNLLQVLKLKLLNAWTRKAIAIGYCKEKRASRRGWHVYPEGGLAVKILAICASALKGLISGRKESYLGCTVLQTAFARSVFSMNMNESDAGFGKALECRACIASAIMVSLITFSRKMSIGAR